MKKPLYRIKDYEEYKRLLDKLTQSPEDKRRKELLEELANTPLIKVPLWLEQHKNELKELDINLIEKE
jgi:hypothetical protein